MKKRNNLFPKIMAGIALWAIVVGIIWTWVLFLFTATTSAPADYGENNITQEQLDQMIQQFSGSIDIESLSASWTTSTWSEQ